MTSIPPPRLSVRTQIVLGIAVAGLLAAVALGPRLGLRAPGAGGLSLAWDMASAAFSPALHPENPSTTTAPSILQTALAAARQTVIFAVAACGLALLAGLPLGCLASRVFWTLLGRRPGAVHRLARLGAAALRSVHELLWAVMLLAALGLADVTAVVALAVPYTGVFAKVFSELLDEAPVDAADALAGLGGGSAAVICWGLLPRALPDLAAYAFYRLECALRSSAVLGFFGFPTLGYYLAEAFENLCYREMWTYLYVLVALVVAADAWGAALRRRWVS